jgi:hypothetical protein
MKKRTKIISIISAVVIVLFGIGIFYSFIFFSPVMEYKISPSKVSPGATVMLSWEDLGIYSHESCEFDVKGIFNSSGKNVEITTNSIQKALGLSEITPVSDITSARARIQEYLKTASGFISIIDKGNLKEWDPRDPANSYVYPLTLSCSSSRIMPTIADLLSISQKNGSISDYEVLPKTPSGDYMIKVGMGLTDYHSVKVTVGK